MGFSNLTAEDKTDAAASRFGGEEGDKEVGCVG
jgi:hypothetical protein